MVFLIYYEHTFENCHQKWCWVDFESDDSYCAIYSCHSAGTTSTAIFLRLEGTNSMAIGM